MLGAAIIVLVIVVVLPATFLIAGGAITAVFSWLLQSDAEASHPDSPYLELNK